MRLTSDGVPKDAKSTETHRLRFLHQVSVDSSDCKICECNVFDCRVRYSRNCFVDGRCRLQCPWLRHSRPLIEGRLMSQYPTSSAIPALACTFDRQHFSGIPRMPSNIGLLPGRIHDARPVGRPKYALNSLSGSGWSFRDLGF